jgi:hypothetical protein
MMAVWRKWEVLIVDDKDYRHDVDFDTKNHALAFCKAMKRMGCNKVICSKDGLHGQKAFSYPSEIEGNK